jgi:inhibitor of KinA
MAPEIQFLPAGDTALVVQFGEEIERDLSARVLALSDRIRRADLAGVVETVPTFRSLAIHYDPLATSADRLQAALSEWLAETDGERRAARLWRVPACYDERCAPDLMAVAEASGLAPDEVVARHAGTRYHVYMVGFVPGLPYMGDLPPELVLPRRTDPRVRVPPGSIAIATTMTTIYPLETPGGWHLIGATPIRLFDPAWERPALLSPGDAVRFEPMPFAEYEALRGAVAAGTYQVPCEELRL